MKTGIIIVFHNYEQQLDKVFFIKYAQQLSHLKLCLVNNESKDNTYEILKEIKEECDNISVVNIKKFKSDMSAAKAGARFMFNENNFKHIGYINTNLINQQNSSLISILRNLSDNQNEIKDLNLRNLKKHKVRQTLFQKLFSIPEYLHSLDIQDKHLDLHSNNF